MVRRIDITDKLQFDADPVLVVKEQELTVHADAPTMLKIMGLMNRENVEASQIQEAYELLFSEADRKKLDDLKLSMKDWMVVVQEAIQLVMGDEPRGEQRSVLRPV